MVSRPDPDMDSVGDALLSRLVSFGIDATLLGVACGVVWGVGAAIRLTVDGSLALQDGGVSVVGAAVWAVTWVAVLGAAGAYFVVGYAVAGQSLGQRMVDVVVVTADGEPCDAQAALVRTGVRLASLPVVGVLVLLFGFVGAAVGAVVLVGWFVAEFLAVLADDAERSLGDRLAGTVVVEEALATV